MGKTPASEGWLEQTTFHTDATFCVHSLLCEKEGGIKGKACVSLLGLFRKLSDLVSVPKSIILNSKLR